MLCKSSFNLPGFTQHVVQRGAYRRSCFHADQDYRRYLAELAMAATKYQCQVHAYVLMNNHVHLLLTPQVQFGIPHTMQALGRRYRYYFNKTYRRSGSIWESPYQSSLIDSEQYLLTCMRYIELNPVRADMVDHPGDYPWSSYRVNASVDSQDARLIEQHMSYVALGATRGRRIKAYRALFRDPINSQTLSEIRTSLNHELAYGRSKFKSHVERMIRRQSRVLRLRRLI